jgi:hypothetical protein
MFRNMEEEEEEEIALVCKKKLVFEEEEEEIIVKSKKSRNRKIIDDDDEPTFSLGLDEVLADPVSTAITEDIDEPTTFSLATSDVFTAMQSTANSSSPSPTKTPTTRSKYFSVANEEEEDVPSFDLGIDLTTPSPEPGNKKLPTGGFLSPNTVVDKFNSPGRFYSNPATTIQSNQDFKNWQASQITVIVSNREINREGTVH